jgi:hypothetical protein
VKEVFKEYSLAIAKKNTARVGENELDPSFMEMGEACAEVRRFPIYIFFATCAAF